MACNCGRESSGAGHFGARLFIDQALTAISGARYKHAGSSGTILISPTKNSIFGGTKSEQS